MKLKLKKHTAFAFILCANIAIVFLLPFFVSRTVNEKRIENTTLILDKSGQKSAADIFALFLEGKGKKCASHRLQIGFFSGNAWIIFDGTIFEKNAQILDLGAERIDRADLFFFDDTVRTWQLFDSCGRQVKNEERTLICAQDSLTPPSLLLYSNKFFLIRVKSFDQMFLNLRAFSVHDYSIRVFRFLQIQTSLVTLMVIFLAVLAFSALYFKNVPLALISGINFCFIAYIILMTGIGETFIFNQFCKIKFISRLSYFFCGIAFSLLLLFFEIFYKIVNKMHKIALRCLLIFGGIASFLYLFVPFVHFLTIFSLCAIILGIFFVIFLNFRQIALKKSLWIELLSAWIPLFFYVIFRQSVHLARAFVDTDYFERIFDNDYYFGYELCFLMNIVIYGRIVFKKVSSKHERIFSLYKRFSLTERETQIANLILKHYTNKQIGEELFIDKSTVATHVQHIYKKMNITKRTELIALINGTD